MELIQFNKNGGPVTIDVAINGANIWSYEYVGDLIFKNNSPNERRAPHIYSAPCRPGQRYPLLGHTIWKHFR